MSQNDQVLPHSVIFPHTYVAHPIRENVADDSAFGEKAVVSRLVVADVGHEGQPVKAREYSPKEPPRVSQRQSRNTDFRHYAEIHLWGEGGWGWVNNQIITKPSVQVQLLERLALGYFWPNTVL